MSIVDPALDRDAHPADLVALVLEWQRAEKAWQQCKDSDGQVYEPEGLWEERLEQFERLLAWHPAAPALPPDDIAAFREWQIVQQFYRTKAKGYDEAERCLKQIEQLEDRMRAAALPPVP